MRRKPLRKRKRFQLNKPKLLLITNQNIIWPLFLALTLSAILVIYYSGIFKINTVLCLHDNRPCSDSVTAELNNLIGSNILTFRSDQLGQKLKAADVSVSQVKVAIGFPRTIIVQLLPRDVGLRIATATDSSSLLVDANFTPFKLDDNPATKAHIISPRASNLNLGEQINDPIILQAIGLALVLKDNFISFDSILTFDDRLQLVLNNQQQVFFAIDDDFAKTVTSLQFILRKTTIQPQPKIIDLRFNKPVLRF